MLKFFLHIILLTPVFLKAQVTISNLSLTDTTQHIFYSGVDNFIQISGDQYIPTKHSLLIKGGKARISGLNRSYVIKVEEETDSCQMWIGTNKKIIFKKNFICRKIKDPVGRYGGLKDSTATINQLLANPFIYVDIPESYFRHNINITSFNVTFISPELDSLRTYSVGNLLTNEQKELIEKLNPGDKIFFDQIYAVSNDDRRRKLPPFTITIK